MAITKVPYSQLGCKKCHVKSCDQCHATANAEGKMVFSVDKARDQQTCLSCHVREKLSAMFAKKAGHNMVQYSLYAEC